MSFKVTLEANNTAYNAEGDNLFDAIGNLPINALELKTKSTIKVDDGNKKAELNLVLMHGRAMLRNHLRRQGFVYQLEALLK